MNGATEFYSNLQQYIIHLKHSFVNPVRVFHGLHKVLFWFLLDIFPEIKQGLDITLTGSRLLFLYLACIKHS